MISLLYFIGLLIWAVVFVVFLVWIAAKGILGLLFLLARVYGMWLHITGRKSQSEFA